MIRRCPACGARYGHAPECPFYTAPAIDPADAIMWYMIAAVAGAFFALVLQTPGIW